MSSRIEPKLSTAWEAARRKSSSMSSELSLNWDIGGEQLEQLCSGSKISSGAKLYLNGTYMRLEAQRRGSDQVTVELFLGPAMDLMRPVLGADACLGAFGMREAKFQVKEVSGGWKQVAQLARRVRALDVGAGFGDVLGSSAGSMKALLAGFLVDGKLNVRATGITVG